MELVLAASQDRRKYLALCFLSVFLGQFLANGAGIGFLSDFWGSTTMGIYCPPFSPTAWEFIKSLWYVHAAPPIFSGYEGLFEYYFFPPSGFIGIYLWHTLLALLMAYSLFKLCERLRVNLFLTTLLIVVLMTSPSFNRVESLGWYDFPVLVIISSLPYFLIKFLDGRTVFSGLCFFSLLALICLIRPIFDLTLYFIPVFLSLILITRNFKLVCWAGLLPLLLVATFYIKNYVLFDYFGLTSSSGENFSIATSQFHLTKAERLYGIKAGFFSDMAYCPPVPDMAGNDVGANMFYGGDVCYFKIAEQYRKSYVKSLKRDFSDVLVLSHFWLRAERGLEKRINRNYIGNIGMSKQYKYDAIQSIIHFPRAYVQSMRETWRLYFCPHMGYYMDRNILSKESKKFGKKDNKLLFSWLNFWGPNTNLSAGPERASKLLIVLLPFLIFFAVNYVFTDNRRYLRFISAFYLLILLCYHRHLQNNQYIFINLSILVMLGTLLVSLLILIYLRKKHKMGEIGMPIFPSSLASEKYTLLYMVATIVYVSLIITMATGAEQDRYRIYIDGSYLVLFASMVQVLFCRPLSCVGDPTV